MNPLSVTIDGLFVGRVQRLPNDSRTSAIDKTAVASPLILTRDGFEGDEQADRVRHGDPGKAVHHFPIENHERMQAAFPEARHLVPGGLGENISTRGLTAEDVCIGDIFQCGGATIQVSQPRSPCWKIDVRTGCEGVANHVAQHGLCGWYYRVLSSGKIGAGDTLMLIERPANTVSLAEFWHIARVGTPTLAQLEQMIALPGLDADWVCKLSDRVAWLRANPTGGKV